MLDSGTGRGLSRDRAFSWRAERVFRSRQLSSRIRGGEHMSEDAHGLIERLRLAPHPEGGWYRQLHRSALKVQTPAGERAALTTIYYLLEQNATSRWHVVDADEVWHFYAGAPFELFIYYPAREQLSRRTLGSPAEGHDSVAVVTAGS